MYNLTKCGYCCDLCKAYAPNILKNDQKKGLSEMWKSCYSVDIPTEDIYCDGCKCQKSGAKVIDSVCPVRKCNINEELSHCGQCSNYPCNKFNQRKGLSGTEVQEILKSDYDSSQYNEYLLAYDNKGRIDEYKRNNKD
jgi:hypothetical protein